MKKGLRTILAFLFGALITLGVCAIKEVFFMNEPARILRSLCDAFFLSAILLLGGGLMVMVSNNGIFDTLSYASRTVFNLLIPGPGRGRNPESFVDYRHRKHQKQGSYGFLLVAGGIHLLLATACLIVFNFLSK